MVRAERERDSWNDCNIFARCAHGRGVCSTTRKSRGTSVTARRPFRAIERAEGSCRIERERESARVGERAEGRQMANISQLAWVAVYPMAKTRAEILCRLAAYVSLRTPGETNSETRSGTLRPRFLGFRGRSAALTSVVALISSTSTYFRRRVEYGTYTLGSGGRNDYAAQRQMSLVYIRLWCVSCCASSGGIGSIGMVLKQSDGSFVGAEFCLSRRNFECEVL